MTLLHLRGVTRQFATLDGPARRILRGVDLVVAGAIGIALCIVAYRLPIVQETLTQGVGGATLAGFPMGAALAGLLVAALVGAIAGSVPATIAVRSKVIEAIRF